MTDAPSGHIPHTFSDDEPKAHPKDDVLGYAPFAKHLARIALGLKAPNGYVIGLHGTWGSGKSTAVNFFRSYVGELQEGIAKEDRLTVLDFRPWMVSGHDDLVSAFFKVLSEALAPEEEKKKAKHKRRLGWMNAAGNPLLTAAATVGLAASGPAGWLAGGAAMLAQGAMGKTIERWLSEPSLQSAYDDLKTLLERENRRFLFVIDDIDRLEPEEIRSIMQMVKTVGRLPNVVYLLVYDRRIVWAALDQNREASRRQPNFAEKIVQHEVDLPRPRQLKLLKALDKEIGFLIAATPPSLRWQNILNAGVARWIRYPRDVLRLANAVKFSWPALENEIDPQDLLAMEGMRLFDEVAFDWARSNRDYLFGGGMRYAVDEGKAGGEALRTILPEAEREDLLDLLCTLFPTRAKPMRGNNTMFSDGEFHYAVVARRGIGCEAGYDAYFGLYPPENAVPKSVVDAVFRNSSNGDALSSIFRSAVDKPAEDWALVGEFFKEVHYRLLAQQGVPPTPELLEALMSVGEAALQFEADGALMMGLLTPHAQWKLVVNEMLKQWGVKPASANLLAAVQRSDSAVLCAHIYGDRARELGVMKSGDKDYPPLITKTALAAIGKHTLKLIKAASKDGSLRDAPYYYGILSTWSHLAKPVAASAWVRNGIASSGSFLAKYVRVMLAYSTEGGRNHYSLHGRPDEEFVTHRTLKKACEEHLSKDEVTDDERARIVAVDEGLSRILNPPSSSARSSGDSSDAEQ